MQTFASGKDCRLGSVHLVTDSPQQAKPSTARLVAGARKGDTAAFERLVEPHVLMAIALARQETHDDHAAEDAAQEALLIAFRCLNQLEDDSKFAPWFYRIAVREARKAARRPQPANQSERDLALDTSRKADTAIPERSRMVRQAVGELEEPYRLVVTLHYLENLQTAEIAQRLDVPHGTIRAQLSRARTLLQAKLRRLL